MSTFSFTALLEADLLQGVNGSSIGSGDIFVMPENATVEIIVTDNDDALSGDRYANEQGDDTSGQTADIVIGDELVFDDAKIYSECYHILEGSDGNTYYMIEIEIAGSDNAPGQGDDFFTFYGDTPPAGVELTVVNTRNVKCDWVEYDELDAGGILQVIVETPENNAPVAVDDLFVTDELTTISGNVLSNDSDPDGDAISVTAVQGGTVGEAFEVTTSKGHTGMVTVNADGSFSFDPDESFEALAQDEQDSFDLTYTISDDPTATVKHNLMFVLDVSNSTVGTSGNNVFDGTGVGDMNNDGVSNTVLDAEIQAVISAVESLIAQGVDPANIDIGIATFSGIASGFASVDAETLGTFSLDSGNLMETLLGIQSGGWTNYEAGLQQAENWFASQAGDGAQNKLMFLSDGRPIVGYDYSQGQYITQNNADYGDEVSRIANDYGAEIYGIGIGANSDLDYLNDLDNTGGAERVLDANSLNVVVENAVATPASSTATITVQVNGLNEGPEALNDALTVDEDEVGSVNILGNDSDPENDVLTITDIDGHDVGEAFTVTTADGRSGTITVEADGTLTFDPGQGFEDMNDTDTDSFELSYTISDGQFTDTATVTVTVNGKGEPVDAIDDAFSINEDQGISANVLINDTPNDGSLTVVAVSDGEGPAEEVGTSFTVTTDSGRTGTVTLAEDGSFTFDGGDNFTEMAQGETDSFDLTYTVEGEAKAGDVPKHNILFVIDVSGSTSPAEFGGSAVGDQNGDGIANTVLDAEIAALKALSQQIADSGLTADKVDIGLVAFSGNSSGSNQNGASQFLGTFKAGDSGLESALESLNDGGWTNFEAPLQSGIEWFEDQAATTSDKNVVYFLSDGYQNVGGSFDDEAAELASRFGAEMNAVGVGTGSSLEQLNIIDNTGGAEIVTTTDDLTAALIADAPEIAGDQDTATITVTINGLNEAPEAMNDALTVDENEVGSINILANDSDPDGDPISIVEIAGRAVGESFEVTTNDGRTGTVTVQADGTLTFDPGAGFEDLNDTETDSFQLTYTISDGVQAASERTLDFEDLATGTIVSNQIPGVTVSAFRSGQDASAPNAAMIFDADNPTGGDSDLGVAGVGKLLIISEDGDTSDPDDNAGGGTFIFDFASPTTVNGLTFVDIDSGETPPRIDLYDAAGELIASMDGITTGNGQKGDFSIDTAGVSRMEITLEGSGGINDLDLTETSGTPGLTDTATVTVTVNGIGQPVDAADDAFSIGEVEDIAANVLENDTPNDGSLTVINVSDGEGDPEEVGTEFTVTTDSGRNGTVTLAEDGSFTFDGGDSFIEMAEGETDSFDLTYTVEGEASAGDVPKHNILFVIDVSGSTSPAEFGGTAVGDQNGDGVENSVLDAEIAALKALSQQIADSGLTADKVDIGLVAFSGNSSGSNQNGASQFLGTFKAGDSSLENALEALTDGGWTNFEAPLQSGIEWFEDQAATTDDKNVVYFLSDGYQNVGGTFDDEAAELASRFGAEMNAVGVGTGSSLEQLNIIDNTGSAEIVTTTDDLTAALIADAPEVPGDRDTATITVTINGVNDLSDEGEVATVSEDAGLTALTNVLDNTVDPEGGSLSVVSVGQATNGGVFAIDANGVASFDTNGEFDDLAEGESAVTSVEYTVRDAAGDEVTSTYTVTVTGVDSAPEANDDLLTTDENTQTSINVLTNDSDPEDDPLTVTSIEGGSVGTPMSVTTASGRSGTVTVLEDGTFTFDPGIGFEDMAEGEIDTVSLTYTASDGTADDTATVTIVVNGLNDLADDGEATQVMEGSGANGLSNVLANTFDPEAGDPTVVTVDAPAVISLASFSTMSVASAAATGIAGMNGGMFHINADGTATFDTNGEFEHLAEGETATTSVDYTVEDAAGDQVTSTYTVTVEGVNDLSDEGEMATVSEDSGVTALDNVLANAVDPEAGDPVVVAVGPTTGGGVFTIDADGTASFDTNGEFESLAAGETAISTVEYTIEDAAGDQVTSTYSVTVEGVNDLSDAGEMATVGEDSGVTALDNVLANAVDPEAGDPVVVAVGTATNGGVFSIDADGTASFDTNGEFDHLAAGETAVTSVDYTLRDDAGDEVTSTYMVTVEGVDSPGGRVSFNGSISTRLDGSTHVVAIIESSAFTTSTAAGAPPNDMDGDGNYGTFIDGMISRVLDLAESMAPTDKLTLIPSGFNGMGGDTAQAFTFEAGQLVAAKSDLPLLHNLLEPFTQTYDGTDLAIDLPQSLGKAHDVLFNQPIDEQADQNEVVVLTASPDMLGADTTALNASGADIDVVYIEAGQMASSSWLDMIDSDGMAQYIENSLTMYEDPARRLEFGLSELIEPAPEVLATVEEFIVTVDGAEVAAIDVSSIVENSEGDGFTFAGDVDLNGLSGEIDIILKLDTDADPTSPAEIFRLSDAKSAEERTVNDGDAFIFDFDQVFV